jgi:hypothetical protein
VQLPTAREIRSRLKSEIRAEKQAAYERRYEARRLLFGTAAGKMKNLTTKQQHFVRSVIKESYNAYLLELVTGKTRWRDKGAKWKKPLNPNRGHTLRLTEYRIIWWKGNLATYRRKDVPKMMKQRFYEMKNGTNS